jgi:hypothetical protein
MCADVQMGKRVSSDSSDGSRGGARSSVHGAGETRRLTRESDHML